MALPVHARYLAKSIDVTLFHDRAVSTGLQRQVFGRDSVMLTVHDDDAASLAAAFSGAEAVVRPGQGNGAAGTAGPRVARPRRRLRLRCRRLLQRRRCPAGPVPRVLPPLLRRGHPGRVPADGGLQRCRPPARGPARGRRRRWRRRAPRAPRRRGEAAAPRPGRGRRRPPPPPPGGSPRPRPRRGRARAGAAAGVGAGAAVAARDPPCFIRRLPQLDVHNLAVIATVSPVRRPRPPSQGRRCSRPRLNASVERTGVSRSLRSRPLPPRPQQRPLHGRHRQDRHPRSA